MKIPIGLIGAGGIASHHARSLAHVDNATITAVVDIDHDRARALAEQYDIPHVFTSYEEALKSDTFEAVSICLPTWLHHPATIASAKAGKHIICEKPLATTSAEAEEMVRATEQAGVLFMVAQCRRYDNYWNTMRRAIEEGAIGRPVVWREVSGHSGPAEAWFYDKHKGLGPLVDGAIHNYDFARTVFGEAMSVYASARTFKNVTAFDTGIAVIGFEGGDELQLSWTWGLPKGVSSGGVSEILGPEGVLFFRPPAHLSVPDCAEGMRQMIVLREDGEIVPYVYEPNDMYVEELQAFVDAIAGKRTVYPSGADNRASLKIGMAVLQSAESGEIVRIRKMV